MADARWADSIAEITPLFEDAAALPHACRERIDAPWRPDERGELWDAGPVDWALLHLPDGRELLLMDYGPGYDITVMARPEQWLPRDAIAALVAFAGLEPDAPTWIPDRWELAPGTPATTLWRPVGQAELDLIAAADWRAFPPRLPEQPIFYPVLNEAYATRIAREWNTKDPRSGFVGYVTRFRLHDRFAARYEPQRVGGAGIDELWVPAEDLELLNANLVGPIEQVAEYR